MKTYYVSAANRWRFWETSYFVKDGVRISVEHNVKWGSVEVKVPDDFVFEETFDSFEFDDWSILDTGDSAFESIEVLEGEADVEKLEEWDADEYFDLQEALEDSGWEYDTTEVYIDSIDVEEKTDEEL